MTLKCPEIAVSAAPAASVSMSVDTTGGPRWTWRIEGLAAAARARHELERLEAVQVRAARVRGLSWAQIATLLGVSRQAVHHKYRGGRA